MSKRQHTATPWSVGIDERHRPNMFFIRSSVGEIAVLAYDPMADRENLYNFSEEEQQANAAFIVRAANNHEALVEALKKTHAIALKSVLAKGDIRKTFSEQAELAEVATLIHNIEQHGRQR